MLRLTRDALTVRPAGPIIKAADYSVLVEALDVLARAQAEAAALATESKTAFAAEKKRGYEEGLAEGKKAAAVDVFERLEQGIQFYQHLQGSIVDLVLQGVESIVGECDREKLLQTNLDRVLKLARGQTFVTFKVAPEQVAQVKAKLEELLAHSPTLEHFEVKADRDIAPGGCIMVSEVGVVDATLETQLQSLRDALKQTSL